MNRVNYGNITTNGMQIVSVGATTASRMLGHAESALNNLTKEERKDYYNMQTDKIRNEISEYKESKQSIDEAIGLPDNNNSPIKVNSPQKQALSTFVSNNLADLRERLAPKGVDIDFSFKDPNTKKIIKKEEALRRIEKEEI